MDDAWSISFWVIVIIAMLWWSIGDQNEREAKLDSARANAATALQRVDSLESRVSELESEKSDLESRLEHLEYVLD